MDYLLLIIVLIIIAFIYYYWFKLKNKSNTDLELIKSFISLSAVPTNNYFADETDNKDINNYLNSLYVENPNPDYINSKFLRSLHHASVFYNPDTKREYKVYSLCCLCCKIKAIKELKYLQEFKNDPALPTYYNRAFTTNISPNKNIINAKKYLVIEREHLKLINGLVQNI